MIANFFEFLLGGVFDFLGGLFGVFPSMPEEMTDISDLLDFSMISEVMGWVNYFIPLDIASSIIAVWATAMMAYVGIKLAMRYTGEII